MTTTVGTRAMTALKRDGTALIPASLVNVLKGMGNLRPPNPMRKSHGIGCVDENFTGIFS